MTVLAVHGIVAPGVTMETVPFKSADQMRAPSKARAAGEDARLATVVTAPGGSLGSSW